MRVAGLVLTALALGFAVTANVPPLRMDCPVERMSVQTCHDAVNATLRRGLDVPHPLILAAHVAPGPAGPSEMGHRATVTYDLLGMPFPTVVELYYDMGGHWDGVADHGWPELPLAWLIPVVIGLGLGGWLFTSGRRPSTAPPGKRAVPTG
jgi:hypothetical protein